MLSLASRVTVGIDESAGRFGPASVQVRGRNGASCTFVVVAPPGTPAAPLSEAELLAKARACFTSAVVPLSPSRAEALLEALLSLESCPRAASLLDQAPAIHPIPAQARRYP